MNAVPGAPAPPSASQAACALLSLEASAREARDLRYWSQADCAELCTEAHRLLRQWQVAFGLRDGSVDRTIQCESCSEALLDSQTRRWKPLMAGNLSIWYCLAPDIFAKEPGPFRSSSLLAESEESALLSALFDEPSRSSFSGDRIADELAHGAWMDWCERLNAWLQPPPSRQAPETSSSSSLPATLQSPWSGALLLTLPWCGHLLMLVLSYETIQTCLKRGKKPSTQSNSRPPLIPVLKALDTRTLWLRVEMLSQEIDLGSLSALRVGDVLRTSHGLETPLIVRNPAQVPDILCGAFLGRHGAHCAMELLRQVPKSS